MADGNLSHLYRTAAAVFRPYFFLFSPRREQRARVLRRYRQLAASIYCTRHHLKGT